ncbi:hypothetical protein F5Y14DRAFT_408621 [Nemania sp. NC0429]|nr:hypothetical protein F5Y14DRAFT_408621 [Nemania sp. NC0429]
MNLVTFVRSLWRRHSPEKQNASVLILQLPVELIDYIATFLAPADKALLSQTCRSMRMCLSKHLSTADLSPADKFAYLAGIARERPRQWVCDFCMALHPIDRNDKPTAERRPCSCPAHVIWESWCRTPLQTASFSLEIEHHHVQLALKYTRLQKRRYNSYLRAILEPCQKREYNTYTGGPITHQVRYSAYPRIVTGRDGTPRFLLFSVREYVAGGRDIGIQNLGWQRICPHLGLFDRGGSGYNDNNLVHSFVWALNPGQDGTAWRNACDRCATDFSVTLCGRNLYLQVWQDFGPEGSPLDLAWRSQNIRGGLDLVNNSSTTGPTLYHEPGSVHELYGPVPDIVPLPKRCISWNQKFMSQEVDAEVEET